MSRKLIKQQNKSKILLGLTATHERMDGNNILDYFRGGYDISELENVYTKSNQ